LSNSGVEQEVHFVQALGSAAGLASGDVRNDSDQDANVGVAQAAFFHRRNPCSAP
jgi:hypothetical protein